MSYYEQTKRYIKENNPQNVPLYEDIYKKGKAKILDSKELFRLMSRAEADKWNRICPPNADHIKPELIDSLFEGGGGYTSKWFTFDRPYLFGRQQINVPGGREGQQYLMTIPLSFELKDTLLKKMIPDVSLKGVPDEIKRNSCRCKDEGGTITIGISIPVLKKVARNMKISRLGGRLTPL